MTSSSSLSIGSVISGPTPHAWVDHSSGSPVLHLVLPKGDTGPVGQPGFQGPMGNHGRDLTMEEFIQRGGMTKLRLLNRAESLGIVAEPGIEPTERQTEIQTAIETGLVTKYDQLASLAAGAPMEWVMSFDGVAL